MLHSPADFAVAVLASGQSRRFGSTDKLEASFRGKMLGLHICDTLKQITFTNRWVIAPTADHPCANGWRNAGFTIAANEHAATGMGSSLALAAELAMQTKADGLLICLADMPLVTAGHVQRIIGCFGTSNDSQLIASNSGDASMPPALFGRSYWPEMQRSIGDQGARRLLKRAHLVTVEKSTLADIDTPECLAQWAGTGPVA